MIMFSFQKLKKYIYKRKQMFKATIKNPRKLIRSEFLTDFWGKVEYF